MTQPDPMPNLVAQLGPAPFRFQPAEANMQCRAFSSVFCALAIALVAWCAYGVYAIWVGGHLTAAAVATSATAAAAASAAKAGVFGSGLVWALSALALMVYTLWCILSSVTTLTPTHLKQTFVWNKELELRELAYVKLIRVPGLDWLIAPRLYCRTLLGKFAVFYTADKAMLAEFERLRDELSAFRKIR